MRSPSLRYSVIEAGHLSLAPPVEVITMVSQHPRKKRTNQLSASIKETLKSAITFQGTTIINYSYGQNKKGNFSNELNIFGKTDRPCPKCSKPIIKNFVGQRGTHYCKQCQRY